MQTMNMRAHPLPIEGMLPSFAGATTWLNSPPLMPEALRGKVVLVDFWTYTCINWQRTEPYVRAWATRYKDQGLVVIGVHTPEFGFEKIVDNIRPALERFRIDYPVAVDSNYAVWQAFGNRYWPAVYVATPTAGSAITSSARANTSARKRSFSSSCARRVIPAWVLQVCRSRRADRRSRPRGTICDPRRATWATSRRKASPRPAARSSARAAPTRHRPRCGSINGRWSDPGR